MAFWVAFGVAVAVAVAVALGVLGVVVRGVADGVSLGVALGVVFGVASGMAFWVAEEGAYGVAGDVALWVAVGVGYGVSLGVALGVAPGVAGGVAGGVAFGLANGVAYGVACGVAFGVGTIFGSFRVAFHLLNGGGLPWIPGRWSHPIWWDELAVLPFWGTERVVNRVWRQGEDQALTRLVKLAANPFHQWALQKTLVRHLHTCTKPLSFLYRLLRLQSLNAYAVAPLEKSRWEDYPPVRQVYLAELSGIHKPFLPLDRLIYKITKPLRLHTSTPLTALAGVMYTLTQLEPATDTETEAKPLPIDLPPTLFESLLAYPGGSELKSSFACITHSLQATSLKDITQTPDLLSELPPPQDAIRPEVIEALQRLGPISRNIAVAQAASSQLNR
ncbi:MAG: hypothetical protein ACK587_00960, partial [Cyanobacteriota bacterium]